MRKLKFPELETKRALNYLRKRCELAPSKEAIQVHFPDKKDIPILQLIEMMKPDYFITGDKKLLALKRQGKTLFLSAREAMEVI